VRRASTPDELYLELGEHGFELLENVEQKRVDAERGRLLELLEQLAEPISSDDAAERLDLEKRAVRRHLNDLLAHNLVVRTGAGKKNSPYMWAATGAVAP
jgi:predicted ArsR family transcriptional regulator